MSTPNKPAGAATDQHANGWGMQCIVGSFEAKILPLFLLAKITMEAAGHVVPAAQPLAYVIDGLREEWEAFADVVREKTAA